jgi:hypothetical protein
MQCRMPMQCDWHAPLNSRCREAMRSCASSPVRILAPGDFLRYSNTKLRNFAFAAKRVVRAAFIIGVDGVLGAVCAWAQALVHTCSVLQLLVSSIWHDRAEPVSAGRFLSGRLEPRALL